MAQIFAFGDSITQGFWDIEGGWFARLRKDFDKRSLEPGHRFYFELFNLGVSGNTSEDLLKRFEFEIQQRLDDDEEKVIIFSIGLNDSQFLFEKESNKVSNDEFKRNLLALYRQTKYVTTKIIFVGLTPVDESKTDPLYWDEEKCYRNKFVEEYDSTIKNFCKGNNIVLVDTMFAFKESNWRGLLEDGLHPNTKGHELIYDKVKEALSLVL